MRPEHPLRTYIERATAMVPAEDLGRRSTRWRSIVRSMYVMALFDLNDVVITRFAGELPEIYDTDELEWITPIAEATEAIRAEFLAYQDAHAAIPHTAALAGLDPDSPEGQHAVPMKAGTWRALILYVNGEWIDEVTRWFPATRAAVAQCPQMTSVGFSVLDPGSHIDGHVGTNRGALRFQLPIVVPGEPGQCRIKIGDEMVVWQEGEPVLFDLGIWHEAWNDADATRALFMIETAMPLKFPLSAVNRFVQFHHRFFPSFRGMPDRVRALEERDALATADAS
jgi:beta-hydroxylase